MHDILRSFLLAALALLAACASSTPATEPEVTAPAETQAPPPKPPAQPLPERSCRELDRDIHAVMAAHNACTSSTECGTAAGACPKGVACGIAVRVSDIAQVDTEVAAISERYKAQCNLCAREHVSCIKPNSVCREGRCKHEPDQATHDRLEQEAAALVQKHNRCASDADCVIARGDGGCLEAFACSVSVNKDQEQAFVALAAPLSATFYEYWGDCVEARAACFIATPICREGRCSRKRAP
ncbi:MAG TPA: hypothetical protein VFG30_00615 [Polyangiales bacterium]|nr:hypothetical protein [Polyangiales bacterium]